MAVIAGCVCPACLTMLVNILAKILFSFKLQALYKPLWRRSRSVPLDDVASFAELASKGRSSVSGVCHFKDEQTLAAELALASRAGTAG